MTNPIALITGGSRGLGHAAALALADNGMDLIITYRAEQEAAQELVAQLTARGRQAVALQLDVGDTASLPAFAETVRETLSTRWGRATFDHLVNNAGHGMYAPFATTQEADFDRLMSVHLKGPFFLTQALLPLIADGGSILNLSSGLTRFALPGYAGYAAAKGAVEVLTRYLAVELGPRRIRVNTLAPGAIETDFGGGAVRDNPVLNAMVTSQTALGRVGLPSDIGPVVAMLLSPASGWINAQRVEAAGGIHV